MWWTGGWKAPMIDASRFLVQSRYRDEWLATRLTGVTATTVSAAATPAGFREVVASWGQPVEPNGYMTFGSESEHELMRHAHTAYGILENDFLIAAENNPRHLATPDGISPDHRLIAEAKTTGRDWDAPPIKYRRQCQWQMYVTNTERCLLLWNLRVPDDADWFYLGWIEPKTLWIERDETMIRDLTEVADRLLEALDGQLQGAA